MPWTLKFWSSTTPVVTWNYTGASRTPQDFPTGQVTTLTNALNGLVSASTRAAGWLANFGDVRIGYDPNNVGQAFRFVPDKFIVIDVAAANNFYFFNSFGKLVQGDLGLTIIHELAHIFLGQPDSPSGSTDVDWDTADYDFRGAVIKEQNEIAKNAGLTDQVQVSYLATTMAGTPLHNLFTTNFSYTDGNVIDVARIDKVGTDSMNHSLSRHNLRDLMFGLDGDDVIDAGRGRDYVYGGTGEDTLTGGDGDDVLVGQADDDTFFGGKGDDVIWGGEKDGLYQGTGDGTDWVDYQSARSGLEIEFDAATDRLTVEDGRGTDTLASIERIRGSSHDDTFTFKGSGTDAKVDLTDIVDGYVLTTQDTYEVRVKDIETLVGGDSLTIFIGNVGTPAIFRAGSGGGDFTLTAGDRAYGHDNVVDIFRVTTTVPASMATCTEAEKTAFLRANRNLIGNFDPEDLLYVNGVLCTGNTVTATVSTAVSSDYNRDLPIAYVSLTGSSSYGTAYAQATFSEEGQSWGGAPWGSYLYGAGELRDVNLHRANDGTGLISFFSRTITPDGSGWTAGYTLDPLSSTDEMLVLVIEDFDDGDGGMSFVNDPLANIARPTIFDEEDIAYSYTQIVSWGDPDRMYVGIENDLDGNDDGYLEPGGTPIDSDSEHFNFGAIPFSGPQDDDWQTYVLGADRQVGSAGADSLDGGAGADTLEGEDGDDTLIGGDGDDRLFGGAGEDLLIGNAGNDLLDGGVDADEMEGGTGNDTYAVDDDYDVVTEAASEGNDTVATTLASYTLGANLENLVYAGVGNFTGTGNALDNLLAGGDGDDDLSGGDGDDSFQSSGGTDLLDGGSGTDVLRVLGDESMIEIAEDGGVYTITDWNFWPSAITLTSVELIYFSDLDESFTIAELLDPNFTGTNGDDDPVEGNNLGNELYGLDGDDVLIGAGGYDVLDGGLGTDTAWYAGASDDYRLFIDTDGSASVEALRGNEATDYLYDMEAFYFADDDVTILVSALPALGTSGNDALTGSARADQLFALEGDDSLAGLAGDDRLLGDAGNDSYAGGTGDDTSYDWSGDEAYLYELGDGHDTIFDDSGTDYLEFGAGIAPVDVTVTVDENGSYLLSLADGSVLLEYGMFEDYAVEEVRFADTTVWTGEDLYEMAFGPAPMAGALNELGAEAWRPAELNPADLRFIADAHMCIP